MTRAVALACFLASSVAWAAEKPVDCRAERFRAFPAPGSTVPPNVQFRLFVGPSSSKLSGVMMKSTLTDLIPTSIARTRLVVPRGATVTVRRNGAGMSPNDEQVGIFRPETPVPPGPHRFHTLPVGTTFFEFLKDAAWTIAGESDTTAPAVPAFTVTEAWCSGKKKQRRCTLRFAEAVPEPVVVSLALKGKGRRITAQWPAEPGAPLRLDVGPCGSLARDLVPGKYVAELSLLDFAGNSSTSGPVTFELTDRAPTP